MKNRLVILFLLFSTIVTLATSTDDWSFIVIADWHGAESFSLSRDASEGYHAAKMILSHIKDKYGGDLVILPGDTNNGEWFREDYIKSFSTKYNLDEASQNPNNIIALAGKNCYSMIRKVFSAAGYEKILVSIGDHELGDNPWRNGQGNTNGISVYRKTFADEFNKDKDEDGNLKFKYSKPIGNAPSRPFGTPYEETSFAHVHNNALFITVDMYHNMGYDYLNRSLGQGGNGMVTGTLIGKHLDWFEKILIEANKDDSICHIFVQGHLPIMTPVRKLNSSSMVFDKGIDSNFWKLMRKYGVDIYFGGEVHALSASKDPHSNLIQIISRGNRLSNFLRIGNISKTGFKIEAFNEVGKRWRWNSSYSQYGEITVRKDVDGQTVIKDKGALSLVNVNAGPLIHFSFNKNDKYPLKSRQIVGLKYNQREKLIGNSKDIRGETSHYGLENHGILGRQYDAQVANLGISSDHTISGENVGVFNVNTRVAIGSMGPLARGSTFSCSVKFRTTYKKKHMILVSYSHAWGGAKGKDLFLLTLNNGVPTLHMSRQSYVQSPATYNLSDGGWHRIFIKMPSKSCRLSEVQMFIDHQRVDTNLFGEDKHIFFIGSGYLSLGGWGYSSDQFGTAFFQNTENFVGKMASFFLWMKSGSDPLENKGFKIHRDSRCRGTYQGVNIGPMTKISCLHACRGKVHCNGFESRIRLMKSNELPNCILFVGIDAEPKFAKYNQDICGVRIKD